MIRRLRRFTQILYIAIVGGMVEVCNFLECQVTFVLL